MPEPFRSQNEDNSRHPGFSWKRSLCVRAFKARVKRDGCESRVLMLVKKRLRKENVMLKLIRLTGKLLGLVVLVTGSFWFSGCGDPPQHTCDECASIQFHCQNDCALSGDPDCGENCKSARAACDEHCTRLD